MPSLNRDHRRLLENTVAQARGIAEEGARKVLADQYAVHHHEPWPHMTAEERELRNQLRAHGRQLGDPRDDRRDTQEIEHLVQACAYEHWHRMLFARFLAENDLLLDADHGMAMSLDEVRELAREKNRDWLEIAAELAQKMLLAVFRPDDPVLRVSLPPETRQRLEQKLAKLPAEVFQADDSLGWVYQFWQRDAKERVDAELASGGTVDADRIPPKTQLFTEDYMVLFLLENTLGAWWTAKRRSEGKDPVLSGYDWAYLRLNEDGSPAAGGFETWPRLARDLRVLDPCMGSGHFLVFALPLLARMRMEEEGLSLGEALSSVLHENLFGLEIDARCSQIAAFNLALTAWRVAGEYFGLPKMNLACSGLGINASEEDWAQLAQHDFAGDRWMRRLYSLFKDSPTLGSLIDPTRFLEKGEEVGLEKVLPLIEGALQQEHSNEVRELAIAAQGVLAAFRILTEKFALVVTNVPFLKRGKQPPLMQKFCDDYYQLSRGNLALSMVERCIRFCSNGGTAALVTINELLFLGSFKKLREKLLKEYTWNTLARLGPGAFETVSGEVVNVVLIATTRQPPSHNSEFSAIDVVRATSAVEKAVGLTSARLQLVSQKAQFQNPDTRVVLGDVEQLPLLSKFAAYGKGSTTGDSPHYHRCIWELPFLSERAVPWLDSPKEGDLWSGRHLVSIVPVDDQKLREENGCWIRGQEVWGKRGIAVNKMGDLRALMYSGEVFDDNIGVIVPDNEDLIPAILSYCRSGEYLSDIRAIDQAIKVTAATLVKVPFDSQRWKDVAAETSPNGLPSPHSNDPTQWLFNGYPKDSEYPLQVAVARLLGYCWPRQTGSSFADCASLGDDGLDEHADLDGIAPLNSVAGEASAAERLRALLADAYFGEWSATKLQELLGGWNSLEEWLRDGFFEEHCGIFYQRPFVWHIWDGRKDGFHALVNYHKLAGSNGEGRQTLEKLIYTYLGDWISRQQADLAAGAEGADGRLAAAVHLKDELEKILAGQPPYDIFVRWKSLHEQPIGWEPEINDGVRLNIRPWLATTLAPSTKPRKGACALRVTPRINYGKDRGKEPHRCKEDFPWFWSWDEHSDDFLGGKDFDGARWNALHYSLNARRRARELRKQMGTKA